MTRDTVRFCAYAIGCVMARYRSSAIAHRFSMDAVQHSTSHVSHSLHTTPPNSHTPVTLYTTFSGSTPMATIRSATASDTMNMLGTDRSGGYCTTLMITSMLPNTVATISVVATAITVTSAITVLPPDSVPFPGAPQPSAIVAATSPPPPRPTSVTAVNITCTAVSFIIIVLLRPPPPPYRSCNTIANTDIILLHRVGA